MRGRLTPERRCLYAAVLGTWLTAGAACTNACGGGSEPRAGGKRPRPAPPPAPSSSGDEGVAQPDDGGEAPSRLAALLRQITGEDDSWDMHKGHQGHTKAVALSDAVEGCKRPFDECLVWKSDARERCIRPAGRCKVWQTAAYSPEREAWLVLAVDYGEGWATGAELIQDDGDDRKRVLESDAEPPTALRRRLARFQDLAAPDDLIADQALSMFSLSYYAELVSLSAPLDGWVLWLETTGLETREQRLWLVHPERDERHVLGRRPAQVGPCDGGGYWCERKEEDPDAECTDADLEAEGRLCTEPDGIELVALAPDGTLLVQGTHQVAGHGGYPPFHWVVELPEGLP